MHNISVRVAGLAAQLDTVLTDPQILVDCLMRRAFAQPSRPDAARIDAPALDRLLRLFGNVDLINGILRGFVLRKDRSARQHRKGH